MKGDERPLSEVLERLRELLFPGYPPEEGREKLDAVLHRAGEGRSLNDVLFERLRPESDPAEVVAEWAKELFRDMDDHTVDELYDVVAWLEADPANADRVFESRFAAFLAGLKAGERI